MGVRAHVQRSSVFVCVCMCIIIYACMYIAVAYMGSNFSMGGSVIAASTCIELLYNYIGFYSNVFLDFNFLDLQRFICM